MGVSKLNKAEEQFMKLRIADAHVHLEDVVIGEFSKPRAILDAIADKGVTDISVLAYMPFSDIVSNLRMLYWKANFDRIKIRAFGTFHENDIYGGIPYEKQYDALMKLGCDGIKFLQMKPDRRKFLPWGINDPAYDKAFSAMEEAGTPVLIHSGDPETFWDPEFATPQLIARGWFYGDGTYPTSDQLYAEDFQMLDKHPKLNVTFAHFFFLSNKLDEAKRVMDKYENVKFDLTPGYEMYLGFSKNIDAWHDFFEQYSDRILLGTDSHDRNPIEKNQSLIDLVVTALTHDKSEYEMPIRKNMVKGLDLSSKTVQKICYDNYINFVGSEVKSINHNFVQECAERILHDIKDDPTQTPSIQWLKTMLLAK